MIDALANRSVGIAGVGMTPFTRHTGGTPESLAVHAAGRALDDAGADHRDVQAIFAASMFGGPGIGQRMSRLAGLSGIPVVNVENACASGATALVQALAWIGAGFADSCLIVGVDVTSEFAGPLPVPTTVSSWVTDAGLSLPGWYALQASRYTAEHGLTAEQLATVVVKSRQMAANNPYAYLHSPVTVAEVLSSRPVAAPLTLMQCCPKVDGAAAAVVCTADYARSRRMPLVPIRGMAMRSGLPLHVSGPPMADAAYRTAEAAYEDGGIEPADVDVAEVHDAFSIGEILYTEALGFCPAGRGAEAVASGTSRPVVNPSGGLLSRGHPIAASGLAQVAELVWQLRGTAARQVDGPRLALAQCMGASDFELDATACVVTLLERTS